jgi:glutaconyl-CoA/methylmalonyl-CoA decarboxylase subunit delta
MNIISIFPVVLSIDVIVGSFALVGGALAAILVIFLLIRRVINLLILSKLKKDKNQEVKEDEISMSGEVSAAISAALYLYMDEGHDEESNIVTIKRISKLYSPWSSKLYSLTPNPKK